MDLPPPFHLETEGAARAKWGGHRSPEGRHQLGAKEAPSPNGGASPEVVSPTNSLSQSLHCNSRAMNGTATIRVPTPQMATAAWMAGLVMLLSRPATAPAVMLSP